jgi:hypothetical protein
MTLTWLRMDARRRWQSLVILGLLMALATTTVLAAIAGARRGDTAISRLQSKTLPATLTVLPNQPGFNWDLVRALPEVETLTTFAVEGYAIKGNPAATQNVSFPFGDDNILRTIERPIVLQGRVLNPHREDEVNVTGRFLKANGKKLGDTLTLSLLSPEQVDNGLDPADGDTPKGPQIRVRIVGVIRSLWFLDNIGGTGGLVPSPALFTQHRANFLGHHGIAYVNALVRLKDGEAGLPAFRAGLARVSHRTDIDIWDNQVTFADGYQHTASFEAASLFAFGLAALVAAIFLLGQSVARYTSAAVADLQLLRAPGITPRQSIAAASAGPFLAALAGATVGVAGAIVASNWMPIGAASLAEPNPGISADWLVLVTGWAAVLLATAAGAAASAHRAVAAGRASHPVHRSAIALGMSRAGLPVPTAIGTRFALESGRGASAVPVRPALLGAVVGVLGVLATFTFTAGITDAANHPERFGQTSQLEEFLGLNGHQFSAAGDALTAVAKDPDVTGVNDSRIAVAYSGETSITTYTYSPQGGKPLPVVLTDGQMPATPTEIVLAPLTAADLHARVGSVIRLRGTAAPELVTVTGIGFVPEGPHNGYADGGWITATSYDRLFRGAFYAYKFRIASVSTRPGTDLAALAARLDKAVAPANHGHRGQFSPTPPPSEIVQIRDVAILPVALSAFLVLLAFGAVGHALATAVRRRQHELAVLRALGITRWQARLVVVTQASVLALAGLAFGVPLGLALGLRLWRVVTNSTPLAYHTPLAFWALLLIIPAGLLAANLLAIWPSHRAARLSSGQVLRAE